MPSERLLLRFSDGTSEWRIPATAPEIGSTFARGDEEWEVIAVDSYSNQLIIAALRRLPKAAGGSAGEVVR